MKINHSVCLFPRCYHPTPIKNQQDCLMPCWSTHYQAADNRRAWDELGARSADAAQCALVGWTTRAVLPQGETLVTVSASADPLRHGDSPSEDFSPLFLGLSWWVCWGWVTFCPAVLPAFHWYVPMMDPKSDVKVIWFLLCDPGTGLVVGCVTGWETHTGIL